MPEFRPSKQRRQKSRTVNQNNKNVSNQTWHTPHPFESETQANQNTINAETRSESNKTRDINGNLQQDSLPTNDQDTNIARNVLLTSTEPKTQEDNAVSSMQPRPRTGSDCSMISLQSIPLAEIREIKDNIGTDESCASNPCHESGKLSSYVASSKITVTNDLHHNNIRPREPAVNYINGRRHLSVPSTSQRRPGFRSSSCQRKPVNSNTAGYSMQSDFKKRHEDSVHMKTGANKKRHTTPVTHPFPAAPYFNVPVSHLLNPNTFPYGSQMPQLNLTEHQRRLQIWNNVGCGQNSLFPLHQLAYGAYQAGRQFQDKNYGNAIKETYSRNSNQNQPGKTNQFQNQFKSRKPTSQESAGKNTLPCKDITKFANDVEHSKPDNFIHSPEIRSKETSGNQHNTDSALLAESAKPVLDSSKEGEKTGNQIKYSEYREIISEMGRNRVADMQHKFLNALHFDSNSSDTRASKASKIVQRQTPAGVWTSREHPNTRSTNQIVQPYASEVQGCRSACIVGKARTGWSHTESFDGQTKHKPPCNFIDLTTATSHRSCTRDQVQCETVLPENRIPTMSNKYSDVQTMPPYFDPTVHPLQVFQNGQRREQNQSWLRQSTEKPLSAPCFIPQNALVADGRSNSDEYNSDVSKYAKEHQVTMNATASTNILNESGRPKISYTGNSSCISSTDSNSTMTRPRVKSLAHIPSTSNGAYSFHSGNQEFRLTINDEIEEEMKKAQRMSIPVKFNSERCTPLHSRLNPNANEFSPTLIDSNGNQFTMTEQKGVCYFKQDSAHSVVSHQESNTYEHEVADILVSTSDNILKTYSNDGHFISKEGRNFFPSHGQQTLECYGADYPLFNGYCTAPSDASCFNASHVYNTLPTHYVSELTPDSTLSANNQMHPTDGYFAPSNHYFNETCRQFFAPVQSHMNLSGEVLPSSEIQMHSQNPYSNPGYTLCSLVPMYVTQSSAATPTMSFSGTEYRLMQTPVAPDGSFVSAPGHMPTQTHSSLYSAPEQIQMTCSPQNYSFQAPVLNLQTYYEASQNNSPVDLKTPAHSGLRDLPNAVITQNVASSNDNSSQTKREENIHSVATQNENMDNAMCSETCHMELNHEPVTSNINHANNKAESIELASLNTPVIVSESDVHVIEDSATNIHNTTEFEECKSLLEKLRNRGFTLEKCQNVFSETDPQRRCLEECLEVAFQIIKGSANKLTIDEMTSIMLVLSNRRKKAGIKS